MSLSKRILYDLTFTGGNATGNLNVTSATISNILSNSVSTGNLNISNNLIVGGTLTTVNITSTNIVDTNVSIGSARITNSTISNSNITTETVGSARITDGIISNLNVTNQTVGISRITSNLLAFGDSNTVGNIFTTGGNVGIGTNTPSQRLQVNGVVSVVTGADPNLGVHFFTNNADGNTLSVYQGGISSWSAIGFKCNLDNTTRHLFDTRTGDFIALGKIGIGTSSPSTSLDVTGTGRITTSLTTGAVNATNITATNIVGTSVSSSTLNITTETVGTSRITTSLLALGNSNTLGNIFTTGGNVGIGIGIPGYRLDVSGSLRATSGDITLGSLLVSNANVTTGTIGTLVGSTAIITNANVTTGTIGTLVGSTAIITNANVTTGTIGTLVGSTATITNINGTTISGSTVVATTYTGGSMSLSGNLTLAGTLTTVNITTTNISQTNVSAGSVTATNNNVTTQTVGVSRITTSLLVLGNSNTIGNLFTTGGNVGIGISSPTSVFNVLGAGAGGTIRMFPSVNGGESSIGFYSSPTAGNYWVMGQNSWSTGVNLGIGYQGTGHIMSITTGGSVGIGVVSPNVRLHVVGGDIGLAYGQSIRISPELAASWPSGTTKLIEAGWSLNGMMSDVVSIYTPGSASSTDRINISSNGTINLNGNVGIGTKTPTLRLHVDSGSTTTGNIMLTNSVGGGVIEFNDDHHAIWGRVGANGEVDTIQLREFGQIEFWTGGLLANQTRKMIITSTGNIGINRSSPASRLHIGGGLVIGGTDSITTEGGFIQWNRSGGDGETWLINQRGGGTSNAGFRFGGSDTSNNVTEWMRINNSGYLGIGTPDPRYPLHVGIEASNSGDVTTFSFYINGPNTVANGNTVNPYVGGFSARFGSRIIAMEYWGTSDKRTKTDIQSIDDNTSLNILRDLQPKTFTFIDKFKNPNKVYGFIAQDLEPVLPDAVVNSTDFIPNVYCSATIIQTRGSSIVTLSQPVTNMFTYDNIKDDLRVRIICEKEEHQVKVLTVLDASTFIIDKEIVDETVFVYGQEIDDFKTVNKDVIAAVTTAAVQEIDRQLQNEREKTFELQLQLQIANEKISKLVDFIKLQFPNFQI